ncbi:MAG: response regulator transcription factor [Rhodospirillales bacterium]|nr:response regulator transcription factor [Rhodospirillales bacterium]MCB9979972.1 response regulator transcription factor [Rhodospirillales bacterium]
MSLELPCITLVDDDLNITASLKMTLESQGFKVSVCHDGEEGYKSLTQTPPDVAILDIKMPRMDGLELLQKLRAQDYTHPIIMLTSKDDEVDELMGFRLGADDYITKPFSQKLLIARIRALIKRHERVGLFRDSAATGGDLSTDPQERLVRGDLILDDARHLCIWKNQPLSLTVTEYLLVKTLAGHPGHVKSRDQLMDAAYGDDIYVDDRTIDSHVKRIRKKFKNLDEEFDRIETLYGVGYKYRDDDPV